MGAEKGLTGRVLVTGGAGFLARGIYRRAQREDWDCVFTCYSRDDSKHVRLRARYPEVACIRGDVTDTDLLTAAMAGQDIVIHAAAVKYVDLSETNVFDTVRVNIHGSESVVIAAERAQVPLVIAISTDKACKPVNVYGATKMVMERLMIEGNRRGGPRFINVRYGNVVGSTGSVIPKFREEFLRTGKVSVTDPAMTRFWMSVDEAVDVIVKVVGFPGGSTVIPAPRAMRMADVVIAAAPHATIETIGLRPGEKMHEELLSQEESTRAAWNRELEVWDLLPPGTTVIGQPRAFELTSEAPATWMQAEEMLNLVQDAEAV